MELFLRQCDKALQPEPDMEYYSCVALCALDAVFSIRANYYAVVKPIVERFCKQYDIENIKAPDPHKIPSESEQLKVSALRKKLKDVTPEQLAAVVKNRQRTSTKNGILKAEAFLRYLDVFEEYKIETYQDVNKAYEENSEFEKVLKDIPGQNVAVDYFFMLAGDEDGVKVDTHLTRFAENAVGHKLSREEIKQLFAGAVDYYRKNGYPNMTARHLDHIVWSWQRRH